MKQETPTTPTDLKPQKPAKPVHISASHTQPAVTPPTAAPTAGYPPQTGYPYQPDFQQVRYYFPNIFCISEFIAKMELNVNTLTMQPMMAQPGIQPIMTQPVMSQPVMPGGPHPSVFQGMSIFGPHIYPYTTCSRLTRNCYIYW